MKVVYDRHTDSLEIVLHGDRPIVESDETTPGVILDFDADGNVIGIEILDASQRVTRPDEVEFRVDS